LSNPVPWQNWMAAYLGYTLRMKTLFRGWPVMAHDTHRRRRRRRSALAHTQHGRLESKSRQQPDRCLAATVWAARYHGNMHHSLSPLAAWMLHWCTRAWGHRLKPKLRNMCIRNQWGTSMSWSSIWLKRGQQRPELRLSSDWSVARLFNACLKAKSKHWTFAMMFLRLLKHTLLLLWTNWLVFRFTR